MNQLKLHEHEGSWYRETGEVRAIKQSEPFIEAGGVSIRHLKSAITDQAYTILEPVTVANWPRPTVTGVLDAEAPEIVQAIKASEEIWSLAIDGEEFKRTINPYMFSGLAYVGITPQKPKRWRADTGEEYAFITSSGMCTWGRECGGAIDTERYKLGNYFQTVEEAKAAWAKLEPVWKDILGEE